MSDKLVEFANQYPVAIVVTLAIGAFVAFTTFAGQGGKKKKTALDGSSNFASFLLSEKIKVSHDTRIFRFKLPEADMSLGLPIGQHMYLKANINGEDVQRAYTPITGDDDLGHFDLMVKVYFKNVHPKFPDGGKLSQHLEAMEPGKDTILVRGPTGRFEYLGNGKYHTKQGVKGYGPTKTAKQIGFIAGGTGITPVLQVMNAILKNPEDTTEMYILFANQTEEDILLRDELERRAKDPRIKKLHYTLDRPPATGWKYSSGFINEDMIRDNMPKAGEDTIILMCGPPPMITYACKPNLEKTGHEAAQMFNF